ncbi:hypothetical protein [Halorubrum xinjiangense]|uniref:hypothetical protein n=1 Tax=Halorubrum xinjiangense TaxID=261291 RepID=UPI00122D78F8|nr:hypothetical protein [Halorubrum xinjiangense]
MKAILLPGSDIVQNFASEVRMEAEKTEWSESLNRIEGMGLLLTAFALTVLLVAVIIANGWINDLIRVIGLSPTIVLTIAIPLLYLHGIISALRRIDAGESVLMSLGDHDDETARSLKITTGGVFVSAAFFMIFSLGSGIVETILIVMMSLVIAGFLTVGLTCWLRVALSK